MEKTAESDSEDVGLDLFKEPEDFYQPEKEPTTVVHRLLDGRELSLRLVGHSPLWGHHLFPSSRILSQYLQQNPSLTAQRTVLELGSASGLPSITASLLSASFVLAADYPDADLISNLQHNVSTNCPGQTQQGRVSVEGYVWGADPSPLLAHLPTESKEGFDLLLLADLNFNHSQHHALLRTIAATLRRSSPTSPPPDTSVPEALVFFTPHRPHLLQADLALFELAQTEEYDFKVEKILDLQVERPMFPEDDIKYPSEQEREFRRTVFGYRITWA